MISRVVACALTLSVASAIFEDQVDVFDWHQEHIGAAKVVKYEGARAFVGTEAGVIASLNVRTGTTAWRFMLPPGEELDQIVLLPKQRSVLVLSDAGKHWQVLGAKSGALICEGVTYFGARDAVAAADAVALGDNGRVALLAGNRVFALDAPKCVQLWSYAPAADATYGADGADGTELRLDVLAPAVDGGSVTALGRTAGDAKTGKATAVALALDGAKGTVSATGMQPTAAGRGNAVWIARPDAVAGEGAPTLLTLADGDLVATDVVGGEEVRTPLAQLGAGKAAFHSPTLHAVAPKGSLVAAGLCALRTGSDADGAAVVVGMKGSLSAESFKSFDAGASHAFSLAAPQPALPEELRKGGPVLLAVSVGAEATDVEAFATADGASLAKAAVPLPRATCGGAAALFPALYTVRRDNSLGVRALLATADHGLTMLQPKRTPTMSAGGGVGTWSRDEALASVTQVLFVDVRAAGSKSGAAISARQLPGFAARLSMQVEMVAGFSSSLLSAVSAAAAALVSTSGGARDSSALEFGKAILVMTRPGKLFALHGATGEVLWSRYFGGAAGGEAAVPHLFEGSDPSEVLVANVGGTSATWLDAGSGDTLRTSALAAGSRQMLLLPAAAAADMPSGVLLTLDAALHEVSLLPDNNASRAALTAAADRFTFHTTSVGPTGQTVLSGHRILKAPLASGGGSGFKAMQLWTMVLPPQERIVNSAGSPLKEVVSSPVRIRGDDSLLLKYLNPHTVALMTVREEADADARLTAAGKIGGFAASQAVLYVVDTVSGRTLHRVVHEHGAAPVHIVQTENWVVYTLWNSKAKRTELGSMVLYEGFVDKYGLSPWTRPEVTEEFSSHAAAAPIVLHKTFVFPTGVKALSTTATLHGITSKHLLVGLASDQLYSLDRRFVDPRRPAKPPTPEEQAEGLMQFDPNLPLIPNSIISYNKTVRLRGRVGALTLFTASPPPACLTLSLCCLPSLLMLSQVARMGLIAASPAKFESISLVLAAGLDLFFVRTTPSQSFDLLASDYNHPLLILLMVALISATTATWYISSTQALNKNWA